MKIEHQLRSFYRVLEIYDGVSPLHRFLFAYFRQNKQMGSSDRRWVSRYLYSYFRLGRAVSGSDIALRLAVGDFLCNETTSLVIQQYLPVLDQSVFLPTAEKVQMIQQHFPDFLLEEVFSFQRTLSSSIEKDGFYQSYFVQPDLFLRVEQGFGTRLKHIFDEMQIRADLLSDTVLALPNGTKLDHLIAAEQQHFVVQDLSSQQTGAYFQAGPWEYWWDCCAASGGKSLLLKQLEPTVQLLVSDVRESSLKNLEERFHLSGIRNYQKKVLDLLQNNDPDLHHYEFDGIILDAPCSGSGTWGRTPEMLSFFEGSKVDFFAKLQKSIAGNVTKYLKPGKPLIYITCSVFKTENEDVVAWIAEHLGFHIEEMQVIKGYHRKADTMFVARMIKT